MNLPPGTGLSTENFNKRLFLEGKVLSYNIKISESKANFAKVLPP